MTKSWGIKGQRVQKIREEKSIIQQVFGWAAATGFRLHTKAGLGLCRHSHTGQDSLLGPLPHLSPFSLQPMKGPLKTANEKHPSELKLQEEHAKYTPDDLTCACASFSTVGKIHSYIKIAGVIRAFVKTQTVNRTYIRKKTKFYS